MTRPSLAILLATILAAGLRLAGALNDFWLDEVWGHVLAAGADSAGEVFTKVRFEHHVLYTLYMHLAGEGSELRHRLPAILCGTAAVPLAALAWTRRDGRAAVTAAVLNGLSFPLITYSSEARGYAPAAFLCLAAYLLQKEYCRRRSAPVLAALWGSMVLALLANITAVFVMAGLAAWSLGRVASAGGKTGKALADAAAIHFVPGVFAALFYLGLVSRWETTGGNVLPGAAVITRTLALATGVPSFGSPAPWGGVVFAVFLAAGLAIVRRDGEGEWIFFTVALVIAPLAVVAGTERVFLYPRYFVVLLPFFLLLASRVLAAAMGLGAAGRVGALAALALFGVSSLGETARFLTLGRGSYSEAVRHMAERTPSRTVAVAGDHAFRNGLLLQYYGNRAPGDRRFVYLAGTQGAPSTPEWYIVHSLERDFRPADRVSTPWGTYGLERVFPYYGLSGFHWALYRRGRGPAGAQGPFPSPGPSPLR